MPRKNVSKSNESRSLKAIDFAKEVVAYYTFKQEVDPLCVRCKGKGRYEEISGHNGDFYDTNCECAYYNRPDKPFVYGEELLEIAQAFLKTRPRRKQ